jgi:hypothetical protein
MSQAGKPNTTNRLSRRSALAGLAGAAAAGATALPAAALGVDPIFAVIAEHRAAVEAWIKAIDAEADEELEDGTPEAEAADAASADAMDRREDAWWEVMTIQPTTLAGCVALLAHVGLPEFLKEPELEHEDGRETFLSGAIHGWGGPGSCKMAAQDFPVRLAETMRALIGEQS